MTLETLESEKQLVIFNLAAEAYAVDIGTVREIIRMLEITKVPRTAKCVQGVINLQGRVIPVVDLRNLFGLSKEDATKDTRILVVDISGQDIGVVVDAVNEVLRVPSNTVEPPSSLITTNDSDFLTGIVKTENRLIIFLDLERTLADINTSAIVEKASQRLTPASS